MKEFTFSGMNFVVLHGASFGDYDRNGQPLPGSFMDYVTTRAGMMPEAGSGPARCGRR